MNYRYKTYTIDEFLERLAAAEPAPGGGSVAAFSCGMGCGLLSMAGRYAQKKPYDPEYGRRAALLVKECDSLRRQALTAMAADTRAFLALHRAYTLPRTNKRRAARVQALLQPAAAVPLRTARLSVLGLRAALKVQKIAGVHLQSDVRCAVYTLQAAFSAAVENVRVNLALSTDVCFVRETESAVRELTVEAGQLFRSGLKFKRKRGG